MAISNSITISDQRLIASSLPRIKCFSLSDERNNRVDLAFDVPVFDRDFESTHKCILPKFLY